SGDFVLVHSLYRIAIDRWMHLSLLVMCALALAIGSAAAQAQTQVSNTARVGLSSGAADSNPANDESTAVVNVIPLPAVTYDKPVSAPNPTVQVGESIAFTLTVSVANSATTGIVTLTDTLGAGLDFGAIIDAGAFSCNAANPLVCTL